MKQKGFLLAAGVSLAMVFTFSCSGDDGTDGAQGIQGDAGEGCSMKSITEGIEITCGLQVDTLKNGSNGASGSQGAQGPSGNPGSNGEDGEGCSVEKYYDGGFVITCGESTVGIAFCGSENTLYNPLEQLCDGGELKDIFTDIRDGKQYNYVEIGDYLWMADNLTYGKDDGKYTWTEAQTACPAGWKLPTKEEVEGLILVDDVFTLLNLVTSSYWWNVTNYDEESAYVMRSTGSGSLNVTTEEKNNSYFVRCVKAN